ncbi:hypothetical protein DPMN_001964 [Dreissena polymorpha]|uniref:Uncharacterized protein n=1 Tax=Dreissena polymorpha TaxID=45954 RepID=A0A9D4MMQ1_DREPO|nr:hypothetical protein DPMN_001964 [Dreissena polymorpha]
MNNKLKFTFRRALKLHSPFETPSGFFSTSTTPPSLTKTPPFRRSTVVDPGEQHGTGSIAFRDLSIGSSTKAFSANTASP